MLVRDNGIEPDVRLRVRMVGGRGLKCTSQIRGQARINTFHHPEKLLRDGDEDEDEDAA
jgi:hypothetical protein